MLARLLTTPFRLARSYREELLIVAFGLLYQAGASGAVARGPRHAHERPVAPAPVEAAVEAAVAAPRVVWVAPSADVVVAAAPVAPVAPAAARAAARRAATVVRVETQASEREAARRAREIQRARLAAAIREARARSIPSGGNVTVEAAENMAAAFEVEAFIPAMDSLPVTAMGAARGALDEARVRAALARALAAQQALLHNGQGT